LKLGDGATVQPATSNPIGRRFNRLSRILKSRFVVTPEGFDGIMQILARPLELIAAEVGG
jgi:hypothetical protein